MVNGGAKVKCAVTVVGPARSGVGAEMSDTQLSRGVEGMGTKVKFVAMQSVEGGDFRRGGDGGGPRTEHVEGEFGGREEEVPKVGGEGDVGGCKAGDEVVFGSAHGAFGSESTMLAGGGECDSDVRVAEKINEGLGGLVVNVEVEDGVVVGFEEREDARACRAA